MSYFKYDNKQIYYSVKGTQNPLILLPGNTASSQVHKNDIDFFAENNFHVICPDYIGYGQSDRVEKLPVNFWYENAQMVISLMKQLNFKKYNIIGTSGGALIGLNIAAMLPEKVKSLIADSFRLDFNEKEVQNILADRNNISENQKYFWQLAHGDDWQEVIEKDSQMFLEFAKTKEQIIKEDIKKISCKVLLTGSINDDLIPDIQKHMNYVLNKVQNSKAIIYSKGDHPVIWTQALDFRKDALNFLM
jgi:pimeloyl-ACP methyl ester carboxylesterase